MNAQAEGERSGRRTRSVRRQAGGFDSPAERSLVSCGLHLGALWALAFVQPLFDLLGRNADFFVARHNERGDILVFAIGFTVLPPLAMLGLEWVAKRIRPVLQVGLHLVIVALLTAALALEVLKDNLFSGPAGLLFVLAAALGVVAAVAYARTRFVPSLLSVLAVAPAVFLVAFLLFSDVSRLVLPQRQAKAASGVVAHNPVVVVVMDETPVTTLMDAHGRIDSKLLPNIASLASQATWYRNATTVADKTPRAIPALLTGDNPGYSKLPTASDQPDNLFTLVGRTYRVEDFETATALCPRGICKHGPQAGAGESFGKRMHSLVSDLRIVSEHLLFPNSIRRHLPPVDQTFGNFAGPSSHKGLPSEAGSAQLQIGRKLRAKAVGSHTEFFDAFKDSITAHPRSLYFIYFQVPHYPWQHYPNGQRYTSQGTDLGSFLDERGRWTDDHWLVAHAYERYLLQAAYADSLIGKMIARMKQVGIWNRSLVVITADHGAGFIPGESRRDADRANLAEIGTIPMIIKAPGQRRGRVSDEHVDSNDLLPTIADLLGIDLPWEVEGRSAADGGAGDEVSVAASSGDTITVPLSEMVRKRDAAVADKVRLFGSDRPPQTLFRFGPHSELIGRSVASVGTAPAGAGHLELDDPENWANVDTGRALLPGEVKGTLTHVPAGQPVAVALNGTIATTARSVDDDGVIRLLSLVPNQALKAGPNSVEIYLIRGSGRRVSLQPLGGTSGG
jgi:hypothetical protein